MHEGVVRSIKGFGAFVDIGGVDGLLPIGEMSWGRVSKADDLLKTGDQIKVKVLKIDRDDPQAHARIETAHAQPLGKRGRQVSSAARRSRARSRKIMDFGAFVELEPGVEGLIHISELSPTA